MPDTDEATELDLRGYLTVLRRRAWVIALAVIVVAGVALVSSYSQTKIYRATAEIQLRSPSTQSVFEALSQIRDPTRVLQTEMRILGSRPVRDAVVKKIGPVPKVKATQAGTTDIIEVSVESASPARATLAADTYARSYIELRRTQAIDEIVAAGQQLDAKIADLQKQIDAQSAQVDQSPNAKPSPAQSTANTRINELLQQQSFLKQKLDNLQIQQGLNNGGAELVASATTPISPVRPTPRRTGIVALFVGLMFGVGLAFLFEYLDDSIKHQEDLVRALGPAIPVLGLVPLIPWRNKAESHVISIEEPDSLAAESYRSIRTSIQFMSFDKALRTLQVTSPSAAEGKTTTLTNLAVVLARADQNVIIVDCDLRRPRIHTFFGLSNSIGFTSVMLGDVPLSVALQRVPGQPNLRLLASGPIPPNPSELLASPRTHEIFTTLQSEGAIVLIDTPPVLPVTDATVVAANVDATLLVTSVGSTTRKHVHRALDLLGRIEAPLVGAVLNQATDRDEYGGGYKYGYRYAYKADVDGETKRAPRNGDRPEAPVPVARYTTPPL